MATTVARLQAVLEADTRGFDRTMDQSSSRVTRFAKAAALGLGAAGVAGAVATLKVGWDEWTESTKVTAQTNAVLKSTGEIANVTATHVDDLANRMLKKTGIDDEAIRSGENLLLTFTNIRNEAGKGNDIFDQTTKSVLDMSVALGEDMKGAAIRVGKALQDPIKGITALRRVGVQFTDAQKDQIKALVDSGKSMEAQKLILRELNREFGGSAEAAGKTLPGQINILKETFRNFAGEIVARVVPALTEAVGWLRDHWPEISAAVRQAWEQDIKPVLAALIDLVVTVVTVIRDNWGTIGPIVMAAATVIGDAVKVIVGALRLIVDLIHGDWAAAWADMKTIVAAPIDAIKTILVTQVTIIAKLASAIGNAIRSGIEAPIIAMRNYVTGKAGPLLQIVNMFSDLPGQLRQAISSGAGQITGAIAGMLASVHGGMERVVGAITAMFNTVKTTFANIPGEVTGAIRGAVNAVGDFADNAFRAARHIGEALFNGIKDGFAGVDGALVRIFKGAVNAVIGAWNAFKIPGFHIYVNLPKPIPDINFDTPDISFPNIPFLAEGGIVTRPTLAVLGERGREAVVPLDKGGVGNTYVFNFPNYIGSKSELMDTIRNEAQLIQQRTGRPAFG